MIKIQVVSDLHLEFHKDEGDSFIGKMNPTGIDVLILAGDIGVCKNVMKFSSYFEKICRKYPTVLYVSGNHELYGSSPSDAADKIKTMLIRCEGRVKHLSVESGPIEINGQRFIGDTMWFRRQPDNELYYGHINDFSHIRNFLPWVYDRNTDFLYYAADNIKNNDVVITHHMPSFKCVPGPWKNSETNRFFVCDVEQMIERNRPRLWISGHTHTPYDITVHGCRLLANPMGYPNERPNQSPNSCVIDI